MGESFTLFSLDSPLPEQHPTLTCGTTTNGTELDASRGEGSLSVDDFPNEGGSRQGGGQAARGQPESRHYRTSTGTLDDERRSAALDGVTVHEHPGPRASHGAPMCPPPRRTQTREGASPPTQSAYTSQSAGTPQSAGPSPTPRGELDPEEELTPPPERRSQHHAARPGAVNQDEAPPSPIHNTEPQRPEVQTNRRGKKSKRGSLGIATLNIKGGGSQTTRGKWPHLWQIMREQGIDVLAIQESHLDDRRRNEIQQIFEEQIHILHSWDQTNPNAKGIAFILNKRTTRWREARITELIPSRAALLHIPWHENNETKILGIYAPNNPTENAEFWEDLETKWKNNEYTTPDFLLGDTNFVEDSIDRMPAKVPPQAPVVALESLKRHFSIVDGWRQTYPSTRKFTFRTERGDSQSRLDRIYISETLLRFC
ncbi:hypothetical protein D9615_007466 [Tricholomella constricta]|uniref:Endonuclease/exonuclease/phosphatase domain-containing protein n=1 Tax=Tricholomella constricta TaxID=117010 RepID=A0A8H5GYV6_9AGAR|nr:hypothetical protein D9615_007466 [Tricholomella constricta]